MAPATGAWLNLSMTPPVNDSPPAFVSATDGTEGRLRLPESNCSRLAIPGAVRVVALVNGDISGCAMQPSSQLGMAPHLGRRFGEPDEDKLRDVLGQ